MKYSFLVPVYNTECSIRKCINSLLNQTFFGEYEIVLYEDVSTDSSKNICKEYVKKYPEKIRLIEGKKNVGLATGRVRLVENAKNDYLIFVDSDDYVDKDLLDEVDKAFNISENVDVVIYEFSREYHLLFDIYIYKRVTNYSKTGEPFVVDKKNIMEKLFSGKMNSIWRKAFKKKLFDINSIALDTTDKLSIAEDLYFSLLLMDKASNIVYLPKSLYKYVRNKSSMVRTKHNKEKIESHCLVMKLLIYYVERYGMEQYNSVNKYVYETWKNIAFTIVTMDGSIRERDELYNFLLSQNFSFSFLANNLKTQPENALINGDFRKFERLVQKNMRKLNILNLIKNLISK